MDFFRFSRKETVFCICTKYKISIAFSEVKDNLRYVKKLKIHVLSYSFFEREGGFSQLSYG